MTTITEQSFPVSATSLSDIPITSSVPTDGQALVYSAAANQFQYQSVGPTSVQLFKRIADPASGQQEIVYNALGGAAATDNLLVGPQTTAGSATKMLFVNNPAQHGAFRAGTVTGSEWDLTNCGVNSFACGLNSLASGANSAAFGHDSTAVGDSSFVNGQSNHAIGTLSFIGNGITNSADSAQSAISNGTLNTITNSGINNAIVTGTSNAINAPSGINNAILAGDNNSVGNAGVANGCVIITGTQNVVTGTYNTIAAGSSNNISGSTNSCIAGFGCSISGSDASVCMGSQGSLQNAANSFLFSDGTLFANATPTSATIIARGGTTIYSNSPATVGVHLASNSGTWGAPCDVNLKENIVEIDYTGVLQQLVTSIPIYRYNYKAAPREQTCMGPMAQDWHAAFPSSKNNMCIDTMDLDGVALASIKGLEKRVAALEFKLMS